MKQNKQERKCTCKTHTINHDYCIRARFNTCVDCDIASPSVSEQCCENFEIFKTHCKECPKYPVSEQKECKGHCHKCEVGTLSCTVFCECPCCSPSLQERETPSEKLKQRMMPIKVTDSLPLKRETDWEKELEMVDFPTAWRLVKQSTKSLHHEKCSWAVTNGAILCDCAFVEAIRITRRDLHAFISKVTEQTRKETEETIKNKISSLRQWINEKPKDMLVTNHHIEVWLDLDNKETK